MDREVLFFIKVPVDRLHFTLPVKMNDSLADLTMRLYEGGGFDVWMYDELERKIKEQMQLLVVDPELPAIITAKLNEMLYREISRRHDYQTLSKFYHIPKYRPGCIAYGRMQSKNRYLDEAKYGASRYLADYQRNRHMQEQSRRAYYDQLYTQGYDRERYYSNYEELMPYRGVQMQQESPKKRNVNNLSFGGSDKKYKEEEKRSNSLSRNYSSTSKEKEKQKPNKRPTSSSKAHSKDRSISVPQPSQPNGFAFSFCRQQPPATLKASSQQTFNLTYHHPF